MKLKRRYLLTFIVLMGIVVVSQVRSLLANYNIVEDMSLTASIPSLKEGETLALSVTDSNVGDTKLVIPVDENTEYMASDYQDASVVFDQINHQVVIDWLEPSKEQKEVTIKLKMTKEGSYPLKALTVRENQEVSTKEENIEVIALEEPKEEPLDTEISESSQESSTEEPTAEKSVSTYGIKTGVWGTAPYEYNEETRELKVSGGELKRDRGSVWRGRGIDSNQIKKITFLETVKLPSDCNDFFSGNENVDVGFDGLEEIIGMHYIDTSNVTEMNYMFAYADLTELDLSNFDTSNVRKMSSMFVRLPVTELDLSSFDTSNVINMGHLFQECFKLRELDISSFDTSNAGRSGMMDFFTGVALRKLKLGGKFRYYRDEQLAPPLGLNEGDKLTGRWVKEDVFNFPGYSSKEFMEKYGIDEKLTPGTYVAQTIRSGHITGETKLSNQTHSDGLFYEKDEVKLENKIQNRGELWNFTYDTVVPEKLTVHKESFQGYMIIDGATRIDLPNEVFELDESSQKLRVNLKSVVESFGEDKYYSVVDFDVFYGLTATINENTLNGQFKIDTTIKSFNNIFQPNPDVKMSTENKTIFGLEPKWTLEKELKNLSRSDELIAVGDELEFTIKATNSEELGAMSTFVLAENSFPNELDFVRGSAELTLPDGTTEKLPDSIYQPDKQIVSTNAFSGNGYVGVKPYQLRFKAKVKDTAYGKILETKATLKGTTHAGKEMTIEDDSVKINVAYSGKLGFKETPKTLSFKDSFISAYTSTIERKDADWGVSIEDTRAQKQPWNLSVKQVSPFESSEGDKLTQVMIFRKNGIEDKGIDVDNEVDVYSENSPNPNDYFISWEKNEGFFLKVPPGTAKAKQYQTELQWNLKDTPI